MVEITEFFFEESKKKVVQGDPKKVKSYLNDGYRVETGTNGTFLMYRPSKAVVSYRVDGKKGQQSVKDLIKKHFKVEKVTRNKLEEFVNKCAKREIELKYSEKDGLYL